MCLVWNVNCPGKVATQEADEVALQAERLKRSKCSNLESNSHFIPIAIETSGVLGPETFFFLSEVGCRLR